PGPIRSGPSRVRRSDAGSAGRPRGVAGYLPGCERVRDMEEAARRIAFSPEEALAYLRSSSEDAARALDEAAARPGDAGVDPGRDDHLTDELGVCVRDSQLGIVRVVVPPNA